MPIKVIKTFPKLFLYENEESISAWYIEIGQCVESQTIYSREIVNAKVGLWQTHKNITYAERLIRKLTKKRNQSGFY